MLPHAMPAPDELPAQIERLVVFFETLSPAALAQMGHYYAPQVFFKDPYNEVHGLAEVQRIFGHMYTVLHEPRFVIVDRVASNGQCFLSWDFHFRFKSFRPEQAQRVHGSSHLKLDASGLVAYHRDYWDTAEEVYEKLPLLGGLMRWLKAKAR